jgi:periplasmic divalent cation tolerance protein
MNAALIWCPFPDRESARRIAGQLLADGLIACANILPELESLFIWEGKADSAAEVGVLFKTTSDRLEAAIARIGGLHPYAAPAIVGWCSDAAHPATLQWLGGLDGADQIV